jgi:hypothetical protein
MRAHLVELRAEHGILLDGSPAVSAPVKSAHHQQARDSPAVGLVIQKARTEAGSNAPVLEGELLQRVLERGELLLHAG